MRRCFVKPTLSYQQVCLVVFSQIKWNGKSVQLKPIDTQAIIEKRLTDLIWLTVCSEFCNWRVLKFVIGHTNTEIHDV
jgi:hypothetical protein